MVTIHMTVTESKESSESEAGGGGLIYPGRVGSISSYKPL